MTSPLNGLDASAAALVRANPLKAFSRSPAGLLAFWGMALDWPDWLVEGTGLPRGPGLPRHLRLIEDLTIQKNLIKHVGEDRLIAMMFEWPRLSGGPLIAAAPDLGSALEISLEEVNLLNAHLELAVAAGPEEARITVGIDPAVGEFRRFQEQAVLAWLFLVVRSFLDMNDAGRALLSELSVGVVQPCDSLADLLPCPVTGGHEEAFLAVPAAALAFPRPGFNPAVWDEVCSGRRRRHPGAHLRVPVAASEVAALVGEALRSQGRAPQLVEVARSLSCSERTLARHLAGSGLTYRKLVEDVRMEMAQDLLLASGLRVHEVGNQLGYSEVSAFVRSFRRRFGVPPSRWRMTASTAQEQQETY